MFALRWSFGGFVVLLIATCEGGFGEKLVYSYSFGTSVYSGRYTSNLVAFVPLHKILLVPPRLGPVRSLSLAKINSLQCIFFSE